jgi:hypothetical protein
MGTVAPDYETGEQSFQSSRPIAAPAKNPRGDDPRGLRSGFLMRFSGSAAPAPPCGNRRCNTAGARAAAETAARTPSPNSGGPVVAGGPDVLARAPLALLEIARRILG